MPFGATAPVAALRFVPVLVVVPPAYEGPDPTTNAEPVKSTGDVEAAAICPACAGAAGAWCAAAVWTCSRTAGSAT